MKKSKVCKYCGEKLEITSDRCLACGKTQKNFIKRNPVFIGFIIILILILISIGIILININSKSKNNDSSEYLGLQNFLGDFWEDISISSDELIEEYERSEKNADLNYDQVFLELTGKVKKVEELNDRVLKVELETKKNSQYKIYCRFDQDENEHYDEIKQYKQGDDITLTGNLVRDNKTITMEYCILGDWETYYAFDNTFNIDLDLDDVLIDARKEDKSIELNSKNIMSFDRDILDYGYTYEDIIDYISQISDDEIKITDISEKSSLKNRTITMKINEKEVSVNLSKDNTCFDESLVYQINKVLEESKSEKLLYYADMDYEDFAIVNIAYSTQSDINKLNKVISKSNLDMKQFKKDEIESI